MHAAGAGFRGQENPGQSGKNGWENEKGACAPFPVSIHGDNRDCGIAAPVVSPFSRWRGHR
jgi:hypothetical protein